MKCSKKSTFHIKFDVFRIDFDENSSEFQQPEGMYTESGKFNTVGLVYMNGQLESYPEECEKGGARR